MMAQNIKNGLNQYIESSIIKNEINANYDKLKVTISEFETNLKLLSQNGKYNTIIVSKDYFKFLENYGFEVISLEETENLNNDTINRAISLINSKQNKLGYFKDGVFIKEFSVATGKPSTPTPQGKFKIVNNTSFAESNLFV